MKRRWPRWIALALAAAVVSVLASCSKSDGGSSGATSAKLVGPAEWLAVGCRTLGQVRDITSAPLLDSDAGLTVKTEAGRTTVRDDLADSIAQRRQQILEVSNALDRAGVPTSRGGSLLVQEVRGGLNEVGERYERAGAAVARTPTTSLDVFEAGLSSALSELDQGSDQMEEARDTVFNDPAMADLILTTKACNGL